jgi:hypothetical protein
MAGRLAASRNALAIEIRVSYAGTVAGLVNCADALPKMDSVQEHHERRVGDQLMEWYNQRHGTSFRFDGRAGEAPDLKYRDGKHWLRVEITSAYYARKMMRFSSGAQMRRRNGKVRILTSTSWMKLAHVSPRNAGMPMGETVCSPFTFLLT